MLEQASIATLKKIANKNIAPSLIPSEGKVENYQTIEKRILAYQDICKNIDCYKPFYGIEQSEKSEKFDDIYCKGYKIINNFMDKKDHELFETAFRMFESDSRLLKDTLYKPHGTINYANINNAKGSRTFEIFYNIWNIWMTKYVPKIVSLSKELTGLDIDNSIIGFHPQSRYTRIPEHHLSDRQFSWHIDRFIPTYKIFYFPNESNLKNSPFGYAKGSHIIDNQYCKYAANAIFHHQRNNQMIGWFNENFEYNPILSPSNVLIIAATHGLHRRTPFLESGWRHTVRCSFYDIATTTNYLKVYLKNILKK